MEVKSGNYIRKLVVTGALGALIVFLAVTRIGLIPWFSGASITLCHIPAIIGAILEGPIVGAGIGLIFGVSALIQANVSGTLFDVAFRNPLVSVLPRVLFPVIAWALWALLSKPKKIPATVNAVISGVLASLAHTVMVLGMLVATKGSGILTGDAPGVSIWAVVGTIFVANGLPEAIAAGVLTALVLAAWLGLSSRKKSKLTSE